MKSLLVTSFATLILSTASSFGVFSDTFESGTPADYGYYITSWDPVGNPSAEPPVPPISAASIGGGAIEVRGFRTIPSEDGSQLGTESLFKQFSPTSIAVGETLRLSANLINYSRAGTNNAAGIRIAIADMPVLAAGDYQIGVGGAWDNDEAIRQGYRLSMAVGSTEGAAWAAPRNNERLTNAGPTYAGSASDTLKVPDGVQDNWIIINIHRQSENEVLLSGSFGGTELDSYLVTGGNNIYTSFNTVMFAINQAQNNRALEFSEISLQVIPESSTIALFIGGVVCCLVGLTRHRRDR